MIKINHVIARSGRDRAPGVTKQPRGHYLTACLSITRLLRYARNDKPPPCHYKERHGHCAGGDEATLSPVLSIAIGNRLLVTLIALFLFSFQSSTTLKGTWQFVGGIYNGKKEGAPTDYKLQRKYTDSRYEAFASQKGYQTEKYEAGTYVFKGDTCVDTETFCSQSSKITNIPIHYVYTLKNDTLTLQGTLPTGMRVEEYWRRVK